MIASPASDCRRFCSVTDGLDPLDQHRDICNAIDYLIAEPGVDASRLGLWGSSFGGGHVIYVAGFDPRVKAVVSQVPGMGQAADARGFTQAGPEGQRIATSIARGEIDIVPCPAGMPDSLKGAGDYRTMRLYRPRLAALNVRAPTLIIDQEDEEYGGRENSGLAAKNAVPSATVVEYHVLPGPHYDIYDKNYRQSAQMAQDWFQRHLR